MDEILTAFIEDGHERIATMEAGLLRMEEGERHADTLNAIFRAAHTIKGDAGVVELPGIERFTHALENPLDLLRKDAIDVDGDLITLLLDGCDHLKMLFACVEQGEPEPSPALQAEGDEIAGQLRGLVDAAAGHLASKAARGEETPATTEKPARWHIAVQFHRDLFRHRVDPLDILRYLASLGEIVAIVPQTQGIPGAEAMDPESCYLGFEIDFFGSADRHTIEKAFEFARDDCDLVMTPQAAHPAGHNEPAPALPGKIASKPRREPSLQATETRQVRVSTEKLDQLIDRVGELVISTAAASLQAQKSQQAALAEANASVAQLVEGIRELTLQLRMVPIGETFGRFRRVVRDLARDTGREIDLLVHGEDTELDKSVVEKIGDPLLHLIRNALDHGVESADVRVAQGKPARGQIELNAYHDNGGIVIEVADDGGGLDQEKILAKAIENGLVTADESLSESEIFNLIFEAGFSTADQVTKLSGRGVGMDVVRSSVKALRGSIEVYSEKGQGSRFVIRLPLTMAIFDGFLVGVGSSVFVIPQERVVECTQMAADNRSKNCLNLRGEMLSCIPLRTLFSLSGPRPRRENVVVVRHGDRKACLVVDELHGEIQTVVKPLNGMFSQLRGITGTTITGAGDVALILDVQGLIQLAIEAEANLLEQGAALPEQSGSHKREAAKEGDS